MKTLIIVVHPNIERSLINKRWIEELRKYPEKFKLHQLYKVYPDEKIDVSAEQELIEQYDKIVFQFPLYWFSSPPLLKKWFDEVLTYGWAFGSKSGFKVGNKKIGLAISAGVQEEGYSSQGLYKYTLKELTAPFELTFNYIRADYRPLFAYYGIDETNNTKEHIEKSVAPYIDFLTNL
ncbi:NAD(P)H-dependent oxidoreductase [Olivibacter ginsenosidimutans]|uniref:NAD(P)H-dependent oxidoreductase n=1 Tax=Olivibacter ginsenosidimutans TaxID=1176537 RepID=A0ABP9B7D9_9SPHI